MRHGLGVSPAPSYAGFGAKVMGFFNLVKGEVIYIAVGQRGHDQRGGGGGGGSFVVKKVPGYTFSSALESHILIIAAGGAGAPYDNSYGQAGNGVYTSSGSGQGGIGESDYSNERAAGGGGFNGNGGSAGGSLGGASFKNGLVGGVDSNGNAYGGFGGGGSQYSDGSPGGGGYTGGNGEAGPVHNGLNTAFSFNSGFSQSGTSGYRIPGLTDGSVVIGQVYISYYSSANVGRMSVLEMDEMTTPMVNESRYVTTSEHNSNDLVFEKLETEALESVEGVE